MSNPAEYTEKSSDKAAPFSVDEQFFKRRVERKQSILDAATHLERLWEPIIEMWLNEGPHSHQEETFLGMKNEMRQFMGSLNLSNRSLGGRRRKYHDPLTYPIGPVAFVQWYILSEHLPIDIEELGLEDCIECISSESFDNVRFHKALVRVYIRYFQGHFPKPLTRTELRRADELLSKLKLEGDEKWEFANRFVNHLGFGACQKAGEAVGLSDEQFRSIVVNVQGKVEKLLAENFTDAMSLVSFASEAAGYRHQVELECEGAAKDRQSWHVQLAETKAAVQELLPFFQLFEWAAREQKWDQGNNLVEVGKELEDHLLSFLEQKMGVSKQVLIEKLDSFTSDVPEKSSSDSVEKVPSKSE